MEYILIQDKQYVYFERRNHDNESETYSRYDLYLSCNLYEADYFTNLESAKVIAAVLGMTIAKYNIPFDLMGNPIPPRGIKYGSQFEEYVQNGKIYTRCSSAQIHEPCKLRADQFYKCPICGKLVYTGGYRRTDDDLIIEPLREREFCTHCNIYIRNCMFCETIVGRTTYPNWDNDIICDSDECSQS